MSAQTLNISLPRELVRLMDDVAKKEFSTRSNLIRTVMASYLNDKRSLREIQKYGSKQAKKLGIKEKDIDRIIHEYRQGR